MVIKRLKIKGKTHTRVWPTKVETRDGRLYFPGAVFQVKDELKALAGSSCMNPNDDDNPTPGKWLWSALDCPRNWFQLDYLERGDVVYEWFDRPVTSFDIYDRYDAIAAELNARGLINGERVMLHQRDITNAFLTYHFQVCAGEPGVGKTLSAIMAMENAVADSWLWVGPASSLINMRREFDLWQYCGPPVEFLSYQGLVKRVREGFTPAGGLVCDESSNLKHAGTDRTDAAQQYADAIRAKYDKAGYVFLLSGTPAPKNPVNWWSQCEIVWPGFLREGSPKALEARLAFLVRREFDAGTFNAKIGWRDDENKCIVCGCTFDDGDHLHNAEHTAELATVVSDPYESEYAKKRHKFEPSINEVAYLSQRLKGICVVKLADECLDLPELTYHTVDLPPSDSLKRAAALIVATAETTISGLTLLRELSDGFQYRDVVNGATKCTHCPEACGKVYEWKHVDGATYDDATFSGLTVRMVDGRPADYERHEMDCPKCGGTGQMPRLERVAERVPCPKDDALRTILEAQRDVGRLCVFAGFQGAVDRCADVCRGEGWNVVQLDGRGAIVTTHRGERVAVDNWLDYWHECPDNLAYCANPESGGMSFTLTKARCAVFWSNSFKPEYRFQAIKRIHRQGQRRGCQVYDLFHLPTDRRVLDVLKDNRRIELMTLGELS